MSDDSQKRRDSMSRIIAVSLLVCFACSIVVSSAAVLLKPQRLANKDLDRNQNILVAAGLYDKSQGGEASDLEAMIRQFEIRLVDLEAKRLLTNAEAAALGITPATYDQRKASKDSSMSRALPDDEDIASISRRARYSVVYILRQGRSIDRMVIPVHGYGLWSIMYGFIALEGDLNTVSGITFYEHGETAGLGGEVDNPAWKASWQGKRTWGGGRVALDVVKGSVNPASRNARYQIDGLSGATLTSRGVENMIAYWLGDEGFGPILDDLGRDRG